MQTAEQLPTFARDDRVSHDTHGLGRVVCVEEGVAVIVAFGARQVRITAPYRKLFKL